MEKEVFDVLYRNLIKKMPVRLHNLYKGVPIVNDAEVLGLDSVYVHLRVNPYQIASIFLERGTYIECQDFPNQFRAQMSKINIEQGELYLTNVVKVSGGIGKRGQVRVEPQDPIWVSLQAKNALSAVTTRLADLSAIGLGVLIERYYFQPQLYRVGAELKIFLELPVSGSTVGPVRPEKPKLSTSSLETRFGREQLRGIGITEDDTSSHRDRLTVVKEKDGKVSSDVLVVHFRPELYLNRYRIGLRLINDEYSRKVITRYITQRQSDLIREFRAVYESLIHNKKEAR